MLQQLDAVVLAVKYTNYTVEGDREAEVGRKAGRVMDVVKMLRRTYSIEKSKMERESIEAKTFNPPDLEGLEFLSSTDIRNAYFAGTDRLLSASNLTKSKIFVSPS